MSGRRAFYLDSSAVVRLVVSEPESLALRRYLRRKRPLVTSAVARTEVLRVLLPFGAAAVDRGEDVLRRLDIVRISDRVLRRAGAMFPVELRSTDAIHLATATLLGPDLAKVCAYDDRMIVAARDLDLPVIAPC